MPVAPPPVVLQMGSATNVSEHQLCSAEHNAEDCIRSAQARTMAETDDIGPERCEYN